VTHKGWGTQHCQGGGSQLCRWSCRSRDGWGLQIDGAADALLRAGCQWTQLLHGARASAAEATHAHAAVFQQRQQAQEIPLVGDDATVVPARRHVEGTQRGASTSAPPCHHHCWNGVKTEKK